MKHIIISLLLGTTIASATKDTCPLMVGDESDSEEVVTVLDQPIEFCCGSCVKAFQPNTAYYIKAIPALYDKFTSVQRKELGVDKVILLKQRYCPVYPERIVNPNSPSLEHNGKTIYFWSSSAVRRFKKSPEKYIK